MPVQASIFFLPRSLTLYTALWSKNFQKSSSLKWKLEYRICKIQSVPYGWGKGSKCHHPLLACDNLKTSASPNENYPFFFSVLSAWWCWIDGLLTVVKNRHWKTDGLARNGMKEFVGPLHTSMFSHLIWKKMRPSFSSVNVFFIYYQEKLDLVIK